MAERKVFTYKDVEEAKKYIGKPGLFTQDYKGAVEGMLSNTLKSTMSKLSKISEANFPFVPEDKDWRDGVSNYQFFVPDQEEEWVPFDVMDGGELVGRGVKHKSDNVWATIVTVNDHGVFIGYRDTAFTFATLLDKFTFIDGTPCGKKVTR